MEIKKKEIILFNMQRTSSVWFQIKISKPTYGNQTSSRAEQSQMRTVFARMKSYHLDATWKSNFQVFPAHFWKPDNGYMAPSRT